MKHQYLLLLTFPFLITCNKDSSGPLEPQPSPDHTINVNGVLLDGSSQQPIPNIDISAYAGAGDATAAWNGELTVVIISTGTTDADGKFKINGYHSYAPVYLGCTEIPAAYQKYVWVNDTTKYNFFLDPNDYYAPGGNLELHDNWDYKLMLFPK